MSGLKWLWAYVDLLLAVVGIQGVVIYALAVSVNPPAKASDSVPPPGDMMICMTWSGRNDADLWATAPGQDIATGYANKSGKVLDLVRDDLGTDDKEPVKMECQFARGLPDGRYVVNAHAYAITEPTVTVRIEIRMGEGLGLLFPAAFIDLRPKQERTVAQFRLAGGRVVVGSLNGVYVPLRSANK